MVSHGDPKADYSGEPAPPRDVRSGRERLWAFEAGRLDAARRSLDAIAAQWDQALLRLKRAVED